MWCGVLQNVLQFVLQCILGPRLSCFGAIAVCVCVRTRVRVRVFS